MFTANFTWKLLQKLFSRTLFFFFPENLQWLVPKVLVLVLKNMQQIYRRAPMLKYDFSKGHKFVSHLPTFIESGAH